MRAEMMALALLALAAAAMAAEVSTRYQDGKATGELLDSKKEFPCYSLNRENYTCSACIQFHDTCAWCNHPSFDETKQYARCDQAAKLLEHGCPEDAIEDPKTKLDVKQNEELSDHGQQIVNEQEAVQLKPQEMDVWIRPKSRVRFNLTYKQAVDYPVDLYYMMDLSLSMIDDREKLSQLGDLLAERMQQITKNFRLGFGSFIDKKIMPFIDPRTEKQMSPCYNMPCKPPYGFKHQMTLTTNTAKFKSEVAKAEISGNLDAPEGGFDAVVQALACNETGWRERARKMIVLSTDAGFHFAGDGRLAGLIEPNDGQCHLDNEGFYTETTKQDYPSVSLLHKIIKERKANIIFAVTKENSDLYHQLSGALPDISSSVGVLANDSRNIVELIAEEYLKISEKIIMVDNANVSDGLTVTYRSKCLDGAAALQDTNVCDGIKVGDDVQFEVTLEVTHCVKQRDFQLRIGPSGLDDSLLVNVHVLCDCDCENEDRIQHKSAMCHGGDLVCGVCKCVGGNVGKYCECNRPGMSTAALNEKCKRTNESAICEGRGICNCGRCECIQRANPEEQISGEFCECDNFNCPRHNRKICAGNGVCNCGQCSCKPGWTGRACDCPISTDSCLSANGKICNGKGECICGRCRCFTDTPDGRRYSGPHCEICPTCPTKCIEYKPCVMCQMWQTGPYNDTKCADCPFKVIPVDELPVLNDTTSCQFVDPADDCTFYYLYYHDEQRDNATVWVRRHKDCPPPVPVLAIVLGVIAGIVILGILLLLVWKLLTILHDRAEYAKFNNERLMAKWDTNENPIYKQATTTFKNPVYAGKSK